jgi:excisionase family DNA binding protein
VKKSKKVRKSGQKATLTTRKAAEHCQVSVPTLKRWIQKGDLASFRTPGGHHRIVPEEFKRFLRKEGLPSYGAAPQGLPLLIVDDDPEFVRVLVDLFSEPPGRFRIETALDGYEALIKVGALHPAAIVLDVVMPNMHGVEVCRRLHAMPETQGIKVLGLTGHADMVPVLLAAGADACMTKPVSLEELAQTLDQLLASAVPRA